MGLVTLGNILSWVTHGRATGKSPISDVMFDFSKLSEVVTDPRDLDPSFSVEKDELSAAPGKQKGRRRKFFEITMDTPLSVLNRFFEWNSAAIITEKDEHGTIKPVAVATKVDLLTWMMHQKRI